MAKADPSKVFDLENDSFCNKYEEILEFFVEKKLTLDSQQRLDDFQKWKKQTNLLIKSAQEYSVMNENDKKIFDSRELIQVNQAAKDYPELVKHMIELKKQITELKQIERSKDIEL